MFLSKKMSIYVLLGLSVAACSTQSGSPLTTCPPPKSPSSAKLVDDEISNLLNLGTETGAGVSRKQSLRGYIDFYWTVDGTKFENRCVVSLLPMNDDLMKIRIATAGHCLPRLPESNETRLKILVHVAHGYGYVPLNVVVPEFERVLAMASLVRKYIVPVMDKRFLGEWLPESAAEQCQSWTKDFRKAKPSNKTACFAQLELRIIEANISEQDPKKINWYREAAEQLENPNERATGKLPTQIKQDLDSIWYGQYTHDMRRRALRQMAYLANVQYCAPGVVTYDPLEPERLDTKAFCQLNSATRDSFFRLAATDQELQRLNQIMQDRTTPVRSLRERNIGCEPPTAEHPDEVSHCYRRYRASEAFDRLVRDAQATLQTLPSNERQSFPFEQYFNIITPDRRNSARGKVTAINLQNNYEKTKHTVSIQGGGFILEYDPNKKQFLFEKGDSGSALNVLSRYPVALLSTIDGEPTSGGTSILALPLPDEEEQQTDSQRCK